MGVLLCRDEYEKEVESKGVDGDTLTFHQSQLQMKTFLIEHWGRKIDFLGCVIKRIHYLKLKEPM